MKLVFKEIYLQGFMSFEEETIKLDTPGFTSVKGINENDSDSAMSNGSGKSTIWEAISWVLTGETIRQNKSITNLYTNTGCLVKLTFSVDNDDYIITRAKDHFEFKTNLYIIKNGEDISGKGIRDSSKVLQTYLPDLTSTLIGSVIILGQGLPQRFSNNSPSGRKEVLEKLSKTDFMIDNLKQRLAEREEKLNIDLKQASSNLSALHSQLAVYDNNISNIEQQIREVSKDIVLNEDMQSLISSRDALTSDIDNIDKKLNSTDFDIQDNSQEIVNQMLADLEKLDIEYDSKIESVSNEIRAVQADYDFASREYTRLNSLGNVCPTCGQPIPQTSKADIEKYKQNCEELNISLKELTVKLANIKNEKDSKQKQIKKIKDEALFHTRQQIKEIFDKKQSLEKEKSILNSSLSVLNSKISKIENQEELINSKLNMLNESLAEVTQLRKIAEEKSIISTRELETLKDRLSIISKMTSLASRDFRGQLLSNVIGYLNNALIKYSNIMFGEPQVYLELNGTNVDIMLRDKIYESLSGGEKQKVDLLIQFSIRDMLTTYSGYSCNILVLDEIFDNCDALGCSKMIDLVSDCLEDVESIYIITHHTDIDIPVDNQITVVKDKFGISRIS